MKILKSLIFSTIFVLALAMSGETTQIGKSSSDDEVLERKVLGNDLEYLVTTNAFHRSIISAAVVGGTARVLSCEEDILKQPWSPMSQSLRQVLETIIKADPRYGWRIEDGVINLLPVNGEPPLLGIHINEFHAENVTSANNALDLLLRLPEVKKGMNDFHLKPGIRLIKELSRANPPSFTVHSKDVTLRQALNAIARTQGRA
ncbi:MAG: hypothetical protein ACRD4L_11660, partial [Pyrinomonadaceae bacterium]